MLRQKILDVLLDKYEKSAAYKNQKVQSRRILLKCQKLSWVDMEDHDAKEAFHDAIFSLAENGVVGYSWVPHEEDNLMVSVWLIQDPEALETAYRLAGRTSKLDKQETLVELINSAAFGYYPWMKELKDTLLAGFEKHKSVSNLLYQDPEISGNMIRLLIHLDGLQGREIHEKVLSAALFGDSKYFRKELNDRLHRLIERYDLCEQSDEDLLLRVGILTNPEMISFSGPVKLKIGGESLDFGLFRTGAAIPGHAVALIESIQADNALTVLFIENSAVYDGIIKKMPPNTLAIYHGGFAGRSKRQFIKLLYENNPSLKYLHWSDIDLGGFRIFTALKDIISSAKPVHMDIETLKTYEAQWNIFDADYAGKMERLKNDSKFELFRDVIDFMLVHRCRLEQENVCL